jgi:hypothetical protein
MTSTDTLSTHVHRNNEVFLAYRQYGALNKLGSELILFFFWRFRSKCEKQLLASSCPPVRVEQLGCDYTDFHQI